jgi:hypothetical protein
MGYDSFDAGHENGELILLFSRSIKTACPVRTESREIRAAFFLLQEKSD